MKNISRNCFSTHRQKVDNIRYCNKYSDSSLFCGPESLSQSENMLQFEKGGQRHGNLKSLEVAALLFSDLKGNVFA